MYSLSTYPNRDTGGIPLLEHRQTDITTCPRPLFHILGCGWCYCVCDYRESIVTESVLKFS